MRRLEQLDEPARVIAFPSHYRLARESSGRKVAPAWIGVAAAAGLILGAFGGQWSARLSSHPIAAAAHPPAVTEPVLDNTGPTTAANAVHASWLDEDQNFDRITVPTLQAFDEATPTAVVLASNVRKIH
jgi:hypothetical protein